MKLVCNKPKYITKAEVLTCGWAMRLRLTVPGLRSVIQNGFGDLVLSLPNEWNTRIFANVATSDGYRIVDVKTDGDEVEIVYIRDEDLATGAWHREWEPVEFVDDLSKL